MLPQRQRESWLQRLAKLKVDKARGNPAPHKPLLILVLCDLVEIGALETSRLLLTGEIAFRFANYWTVVAARRKQGPDLRLPFFHLKGDGFLKPFDKFGNPASDKKANVEVEIHSEFFECLHDDEFRRHARLLIITNYFGQAEQFALSALVQVHLPDAECVRDEVSEYATSVAVLTGREARFRLTVVPAYNYTCALTRHRIITVDSGALVDAAHIHKFADSRNNSPSNGLSLSKNAHWMFDVGLWSLDDDYRVILNHDRFVESGPPGIRLDQHAGEQILLPSQEALYPSKSCLAWHRLEHGF